MPPIPARTPTVPMPAAPGADQPSLTPLQDPALNQGVKDQICALRRRFSLDRIAALVEASHRVTVSRAQISAVWAERDASRIQTAPEPDEHRQDKESVQIAADAVPECILTLPDASPEPAPPLFPAAAPPLFPAAAPPLFPAAAPPLFPPAAPPHFIIAADAPPTRTGPGQEKAAMQIPTVEVKDLATQRMAPSDRPEPIAGAAPPNAQADIDRAPTVANAVPAVLQTKSDHGKLPTLTGRAPGPGPEPEPVEILPTEVRDFIIERMARRHLPWMVADEVRRNFGFVVDHDEIIVCWRDRDALETRTGPGPEKESRPRLSDEIKALIVQRIACYETPSRIAAAVRINFGIDVDRRRIFDYNPNGSRPPAQRWIDLHAATRARFLRDVAEIGVAQKVIRLRALDRFAEMAEDDNRHDKAAKYLEQAARECGGFYEKRRAPHAAAVDTQV